MGGGGWGGGANHRFARFTWTQNDSSIRTFFSFFFTRLGRRHAIKKENGKKDRNKLLICFIF